MRNQKEGERKDIEKLKDARAACCNANLYFGRSQRHQI